MNETFSRWMEAVWDLECESPNKPLGVWFLEWFQLNGDPVRPLDRPPSFPTYRRARS